MVRLMISYLLQVAQRHFLTLLFKIQGLTFWCCASFFQPCEFYHCCYFRRNKDREFQFIGHILELSFIVRLLNSNSLSRNSQFLEWNKMTLLTFTDKTKSVHQYWFWWISLVFAGPFSLNAQICLCTFLLLPNAPSFVSSELSRCCRHHSLPHLASYPLS